MGTVWCNQCKQQLERDLNDAAVEPCHVCGGGTFRIDPAASNETN